MCGDRAVDRLAIAAVVLGGDGGRNELAFAGSQRMRSAQENVDELVDWLRGVRAVRQQPANPWESRWNRDVWHGVVTRVGRGGSRNLPRASCALNVALAGHA